MKLSVIGTGYVGLVSGVCLAAKGHEVTCVDIDQQKVDAINSGATPIYERGLEALLKQHVGKNLNATTDLKQAVIGSDISLIAVGTPFVGDQIDLTYIKQVSEQIGSALKEKDSYHVVAVKSTVVPGTTDSVVRPCIEAASGKTAGDEFGLGMNPEFLREGEAVEDFMHPDRIVLGGIDKKTTDALAELYSVFTNVDHLHTNTRTAEMIKYTSNSLLATMISFSNEIANLSAAIGDIDVVDVMHGVHLDRRLSPIMDSGERVKPGFTTYLEAGCGFGGSCFPKDVKALIAHGKQANVPMSLLDSVIDVNSNQPAQLIKRLDKHFESLSGKRIALLGLAFKPNTDDMRESPAIPIVQTLSQRGAYLSAYDPVARSEAEKMFSAYEINYQDTVEDAIAGADAILLLTRWDEFNALPEILSQLDPVPLFIDGRRVIDKHAVPKYEGIGL